MSATATVEAAPAAPVEKFRLDYAAPPYAIDTVHLDFHIAEEETLVKTRLEIKRGAGVADGTPMVLDGDAEVRGGVSSGCHMRDGPSAAQAVRVSLPISMHPSIQAVQLREITLDGAALVEAEDYTLTDETLTLLRPPAGASFTLRTTVAIKPQENLQLSGLYKSSGNYVTQCEAEGFRRITFFQDRPDIMAKYDCRIEADKTAYPLLLANGNEMEHGDLPDGRHWASFSDPFRKPSYLFCAVAGDLGGIQSTFTTKSGREVALKVWSEKENVDEVCGHPSPDIAHRTPDARR